MGGAGLKGEKGEGTVGLGRSGGTSRRAKRSFGRKGKLQQKLALGSRSEWGLWGADFAASTSVYFSPELRFRSLLLAFGEGGRQCR